MKKSKATNVVIHIEFLDMRRGCVEDVFFQCREDTGIDIFNTIKELYPTLIRMTIVTLHPIDDLQRHAEQHKARYEFKIKQFDKNGLSKEDDPAQTTIEEVIT